VNFIFLRVQVYLFFAVKGNMRILIVITCFIFSFPVIGQTDNTLYFQPNFANGSSASKFYEEVNYIPLETTRKSLFGRIRQLLVSDQYFIIWDADTNSIYFFDKTGKFIKKYRPPKCVIKSIQLDKSRNAIFITGGNKNYRFSQAEIEKMMEDPTNTKFARFSWSGYYSLEDINKEDVQEIKHFSLALVTPTIFDANSWAYSYIYANKKWEDLTDYELKIYNGGTTTHQYFPYSKKNSSIYLQSQQVRFFPTPQNDFLFVRPYYYNIYKLTKDSVSLLYTLVLPLENSLPKSFYDYPYKTKNEIQTYRDNNGSIVWELYNLCKYNNYLFFSLDYKKNFRDRHFMFDEDSRKFFNIGKIGPDSTNAFLPIASNIQYCDGKYLYSSISSSNMFQTKENTQQRNPKYTPALKQYFENSHREANPVIIQLKPKMKIG